MPFKDTKNGSTHFYGDGCAEPEHNPMQSETCENCGYLLRNHKYKGDKYNCPEINIETHPSFTEQELPTKDCNENCKIIDDVCVKEGIEDWEEEYCEKFGLCDEEMPCQCKAELNFIRQQKQKSYEEGFKKAFEESKIKTS